MRIFVAGGTGYLGRALIRELLGKGHEVHALVRPGSESKLPSGCVAVPGNALEASGYDGAPHDCDAQVHLVGVSHPSPWKADEFQRIDVASVKAATAKAKERGVRHFVYVSVAHPAPIMKAYIAAREQCEAAICETGLNATILRPWYVLGEGHRWPYALIPIYALFRAIPSTRETATRLGLVTHAQMVNALLSAVEDPAQGVRVLEVGDIRARAKIV